MRTAPALLASFAAGALVALAAFAVAHRQLLPFHALVVGVLAVVAVAVVRRSWSHLPGFVGIWLDLGVATVVAAVAVVGRVLSYGIPYAVLRGPEVAALLGGAGLLGVAVSGLAYTHLRLAAEVEAQQRRIAELQRSALESRLAALSAQINPHFLFNTLNTLAEVVHEDADAAEELVTDLAGIMRAALRSSTGLVPLAEELDTVRRLLRIEAARLGGRLGWEITGEALLAAHPVRVPGLLIQPLVENAVKHGVASRSSGGRVGIAIEVGDGFLRVRIEDDGPGLSAEIAEEFASDTLSLRGTEGAGGGLRNCRERLRLTWPGDRARLIHDSTAPGTALVLELPTEDR